MILLLLLFSLLSCVFSQCSAMMCLRDPLPLWFDSYCEIEYNKLTLPPHHCSIPSYSHLRVHSGTLFIALCNKQKEEWCNLFYLLLEMSVRVQRVPRMDLFIHFFCSLSIESLSVLRSIVSEWNSVRKKESVSFWLNLLWRTDINYLFSSLSAMMLLVLSYNFPTQQWYINNIISSSLFPLLFLLEWEDDITHSVSEFFARVRIKEDPISLQLYFIKVYFYFFYSHNWRILNLCRNYLIY